MSRANIGVAAVLVAIVLLAACSRDNGLPADITSHLAARGIVIRPSRVHALLSHRDGYIVAPYELQTAANIVSTFGLEAIQPGSSQWQLAIEHTGGVATPKALWGVSGRPAQFKLKDGGQFEYFYLLIATDGSMYLLAEYAYG
jgi:hypothetical protein